MTQVTLMLGDVSGDGHDKTYTYTVEVNCSRADLLAAHEAGCKKLNVDFADLCSEYEDSTCPSEYIEALKPYDSDRLLQNAIANQPITEDQEYYLWYDSFTIMFMLLAQAGNPELVWKFVETDRLDIGGYGLFT